MKLSDYIIEYKGENGYLLTNLFCGSDILLSNEQYTEYQNIIANLPKASESDLYNKLLNNLFILQDSFDEKTILELKRKSAIYNLTPLEQKYIIAPTLDCNARCPYCYEKDIEHKKYMDSTTVENLSTYILKSLIGKKTLNLSWFGGEPLLNPDAIEKISKKIINYCNDNNIDFYANITTNGFLADKNIDLLKKSKIESVQITLDGTKDVYNKTKNYINNYDSFDKVVDNIFLISENNIHVTIRMNVNKENHENLKSLCSQLISDERWNKNISIYFYPLINYDEIIPDYFTENEYSKMVSVK